MALLNLGDDPWLLEYESCEKLQREIMEQLVARDKEKKKTEMYARISASIRLRLKQYNNEVSQLKVKLEDVSKVKAITREEVERRLRNVEQLASKSVQMEKIFNEVTTEVIRDQERSLLLGTSEWGSRDDELLDSGRDNSESAEQIRIQKQRLLEDQERGLESLSKIIARQKNIAQTITTEVDLQNDIIDDLGDHMDRTDARINNETRNIGVIDRKDRTCIYWVIIILLFLCIIIVVAV